MITTLWRFTALWLEHSEESMANEAVSKHLDRVPSRKFAPLMNQLTSRLQDMEVKFSATPLSRWFLRICTDHPFHGMYQIYAGANSRPQLKRMKRPDQGILQPINWLRGFRAIKRPHQVWAAISTTNKVYCQFGCRER